MNLIPAEYFAYFILFSLFCVLARSFWNCLDTAYEADNMQFFVSHREDAIECVPKQVNSENMTESVPVSVCDDPPNYRQVLS